MKGDFCYGFVCFTPLESTAPKFFGFAEFLAALALMVLAWTTADVRYRFRVRTAPIPLQQLTYFIVAIVGVLSLLTDWWRAESWWVPKGHVLTPAAWQALLGGLLLLTFLTWVWFAFIRPATFSRCNAVAFARELYRVILRGSPSELPEIADELSRSARALIAYSLERHEVEFLNARGASHTDRNSVHRHAYDVLLLIADRKFCRFVVQTSPFTAQALFLEVAAANKYGVPLGTFAKNITSEAISNRDSFVYHEVAGYHTGFLGYHKPLTQALYGNYRIVEASQHTFDVDYRERQRWEPEQLEAFCRLVLVTFKSYIEDGGIPQHSYVLFRAFHDIQEEVDIFRAFNGESTDWWTQSSIRKLDAVVSFTVEAVKILNQRPHIPTRKLRWRQDEHRHDIYDLIAGVMLEMIYVASTVREPRDVCWFVQHNSVWIHFFSELGDRDRSAAWKVIRFKLRRLIYDEISKMTTFPNFRGASLLGLVLNVLGPNLRRPTAGRCEIALHRAVLSWTKRHYARMAKESPRVATHCLVDGIAYDSDRCELVFTGKQILDREPSKMVLQITPVAKQVESPTIN